MTSILIGVCIALTSQSASSWDVANLDVKAAAVRSAYAGKMFIYPASPSVSAWDLTTFCDGKCEPAKTSGWSLASLIGDQKAARSCDCPEGCECTGDECTCKRAGHYETKQVKVGERLIKSCSRYGGCSYSRVPVYETRKVWVE